MLAEEIMLDNGLSSFIMLMKISRSCEQLAELLKDDRESCSDDFDGEIKAEMCGREFEGTPVRFRRKSSAVKVAGEKIDDAAAKPAGRKPFYSLSPESSSEPLVTEPAGRETILYSCPHCSAMFEISTEYLGRKAQCAACSKKFIIKFRSTRK